MAKVVKISECFVQSKSEVQPSEKYHYLSPADLAILCYGNSQYGLLFNTPPSSNSCLFDNLKLSVSEALVYFYPFAGRLVTQKHEDNQCSIFVDCSKSPGARLIHASALDVSVADIVNPNTDVPLVVQSFFDLGERHVNHEGHTRALLSVQMTELVDGLFIACCINHCLSDAISLSYFLNTLSQIFAMHHLQTNKNINDISLRVPVFKSPPSISQGYQSMKLPNVEIDESLMTRIHQANDLLRDRIFRFSTASMSKLKAEANAEAGVITLSSFKALCGLVWKAVTRARNLPQTAITTFIMSVSIRPRLDPPLPPNFVANCLTAAFATANVGDLIKNGLSWATMLIHKSVEAVDDEAARQMLVLSTGKTPKVLSPGFGEAFGSNHIVMGGSPRMEFYESDFGLGKPVAVRTGYTNRTDGKVTAFPGCQGQGSVDLQVSLMPSHMSALLLDEEFMSYVS